MQPNEPTPQPPIEQPTAYSGPPTSVAEQPIAPGIQSVPGEPIVAATIPSQQFTTTPFVTPPAFPPAAPPSSSKKKRVILIISLIILGIFVVLFIIGLLSPEPVKQNATTTQNTSTATEDEFNKTFATYGAAGEFSKMYTDLVASDVKATVTEAKFVSDFTALKPCLEALNDAEKQGFSGVVVNYDNGVKKYTFSSDETNNLGDGKTSSNKCTLSWYIKKSSANKWELELGSSVANAKVITTK